MKQTEKRLEYTKTFTVNETITAKMMGSGDMLVLATPAMVAMMENTAMNAVAELLDDGETTVGSMINTTHVRPSAIGAEITVTATLVAVDGRKLTFDVMAKDGENMIGQGEHVRFVVDKERFLKKLG
ncbi:thioesterase family protein [Xylanibacter oryzae]|uniref:thioesterase family protein n=1 Tax=Xylanibacter oryzae TaxID=185293 RepID=UPI000566F2A0